MTKYSLSREYLNKLIEICIENTPLREEETEIHHLIEDCKSWQIELISFTYFLSHFLERRQRQSTVSISLLPQILSLQDSMWLTFQEFDEDFVRYMFENVRQEHLSLHQNLIALQNQLNEYQYS